MLTGDYAVADTGNFLGNLVCVQFFAKPAQKTSVCDIDYASNGLKHESHAILKVCICAKCIVYRGGFRNSNSGLTSEIIERLESSPLGLAELLPFSLETITL